MEKTNKKAQDYLIASVIVVAAAIAFMGGYVLSSDVSKSFDKIKNNKNSTTEEELSGLSIAGTTLSGKTLGFEDDYVVGKDEEKDYNLILGTYVGVNDSYLNLSYGDSKKEVKITKYLYTNEELSDYDLVFDKEVVDIHMTSFDLSPSLNTIFFLLDDGTVEYMLVEDAIETNDFKIYGTLKIKNIAKFYEGNVCSKENNKCEKTCFAQTVEGKIYDLAEYIG